MGRGFSAIVATVLIVSLTVIIGALLAAFVIPFVRDNLSGSTSCVPVQNYYSFEQSLGHNCYTSSGYLLSIAESADNVSDQSQVMGFNIALQGADGTGTLLQARETSTSLKGLTSENYPGLPGSGNVKTYRYDAAARYTSAKLYAVLASGKSCEQQGETITLRQC